MAIIQNIGPCPHGVIDAVCWDCTPKLLVGDRMQISVELIQQLKEDRANGNIVTVRVASIETQPDGIKVLWMERCHVLSEAAFS